jgi:hypothetical protein
MIRIVTPLGVLVAALALTFSAQAQNGTLTRSFVSTAGSDSNPCTITAPCATFAQAYTAIGANGIIAALDPGRYGPLTNITTGVTINGNGWSAITAPAQNAGITINAGSGAVTLIGLEIDGAGAAYNGIVVNSAGSFTVIDCTLQNFIVNENTPFTTGIGILMQPTSGTLDFTISNTTASNNTTGGIFYQPTGGSPTANGVIKNLVVNSNLFGIVLATGGAGESGGAANVTISNSIVSDGGLSGTGINLVAEPSNPLKVSIDKVSISGSGTGINAQSTANVLLGRSVIIGNGTGVANTTSPNTFYTYGDNRINLNGANNNANISGTAPTPISQD